MQWEDSSLKIIYTKSYEKSYKDLKKNYKERELFDEIIDHIKNEPDFKTMINDPLSMIYNLERLKYDLNQFYSFRLSKVIRLIIRPKDNDVEVELVYISKNHYLDFSEEKVII